MGNIQIVDFKYGMDRRRKRVAGVPGTLWLGKNVQISRGGDIERAKKFVSTYALPAGQTFGLGGTRGQLYTFGSLASASVTMPNGVQYQQLAAPSGAAMTQVLDVKAVAGNLYVIARYADGNIFHFYNGTRVTDWDARADANTSASILATYFAEILNADSAVSAVAVGAVITLTARTAGTAFTVAKTSVDFGGTSDQDIALATVQANVATVAEVQATTTIVVTAGSAGTVVDITANSVSLMRDAVTWATSHTVTAAAIAVQINNKTATHGYTALASGANITLTAAPGTGSTPNGYVVASSVTGDVVLSTPTMSGGVTAVTGIAQVTTATITGTFESEDQFIITINGVSYTSTGRAAGMGVSAYVAKKRVWSSAGSLEVFSKLNDFDDFSDAGASAGSGFLNIANESEGSERLVGAGTFIDQSAFFSRRNIRLFSLNTDLALTAITQPIDNSGSRAARSILAYGTTDLLYLDETGIRSLKARGDSAAAFVNDMGSAVDPFVVKHMDTLSDAVISRACSVVEPRDGRFMLALGNYVFVLSHFPGSGVSAWTYLDLEYQITDFARLFNQLYARSGDTVYLYGGAAGATYPSADEFEAEVHLPFVATSPPATANLTGFDMACTGEWTVHQLFNPNDDTVESRVGVISGVTYGDADIGNVGKATHMAFKFVCAAAGAATISNVTIHTDGAEPNV